MTQASRDLLMPSSDSPLQETQADTRGSLLSQGSHQLTLLVQETNPREYRFLLDAVDRSNGPNNERYGPFQFPRDPRKIIGAIFSQLADLPGHPPEIAQRRLESRGIRLFRELFPAELRRRLWSLRNSNLTLQIQSDEPWIPWELCKLEGSEGSLRQAGPFLCEAFAVTRFLPHYPQPTRLPLQRIAAVVTSGDLPQAHSEFALLSTLAETGGRVVDLLPADYTEIVEAITAGRYDGWHFVGHGNFDRVDPNQSAVFLDGYQQLTPEDLSPSEDFGKRRPFVFWNSCASGRADYALTDIGGWAKAFLEAGAGAFIGTYWPIPDDSARRFALAFYQHFFAGASLAEAVLAARYEICATGDSTWLAYTVYANPAAYCLASEERDRIYSWKSFARLSTTFPTELSIDQSTSRRDEPAKNSKINLIAAERGSGFPELRRVDFGPDARFPFVPPPAPDRFTGRGESIDSLVQKLVEGKDIGIIALQGMGGIGKTALALVVANQLFCDHRDAFPGGVLWAELGPNPDLFSLLDGWARLASSHLDLTTQPDLSLRASILRQTLARWDRACVVLDDVWDADQAHTLFQAVPPGWGRVLTTRDSELARRLDCSIERLAVLDEAEALALLASHLGALTGHEAAARRLHELTEGLPLALRIAAGLVDEPSELAALAEDLATKPQLELLRLTEQRKDSVEACLSLSYQRLPEVNQRRFRALGAFALAPFDEAALAAVWGEETVEPGVLRSFVRLGLLDREPSKKTLRQHALLRSAAKLLLDRSAEEEEVAAARHAMHYILIVRDASWQEAEAVYEQVRYAWGRISSEPEAAPWFALAAADFQRLRGRWQDRATWLEQALVVSIAEADQYLRANLLTAVALLSYDLGRPEKALEDFEESLRISREIGDRDMESATLNGIAMAYLTLGRQKEALQIFEESLVISREVGNRALEATIINNIARIYSVLGRQEDALRNYEESLAISRESGARCMEGATLNNIAQIYSDLGRPQVALRTLEDSLEINREVGDRELESTTLCNIAQIYSALGRHADALQIFEQSLKVSHEIGAHSRVATVLNNIAQTYSASARYKDALPILEEALAISREVRDRTLEGSVLNNIGLAYRSLNREKAALRIFEEALEISREVEARGMEATVLINIGTVYYTLGRQDEALRIFKNILKSCHEIGKRSVEVAALINIGGIYNLLDCKDEALHTFEEALGVSREIGARIEEGIILNAIANVYNDLGRKEEALRAYEDAVDVFREVGDRNGEGAMLNSIGDVFVDMRQSENALRAYKDSLVIVRETEDRDNEGMVLASIASVYDKLERKEEAFRTYEELLAIRRETGDRAEEGTVLNNIARIQSSLGRKEEALRIFEKVLAIQRELGSRQGEALALFNMGTLLDALGRTVEAAECLKACVALKAEHDHPDLESARALLETVHAKLHS